MEAKRGRMALSWILVIVYCSILWVLSSTGKPMPIPSFYQGDKILHFGAFTVLALLFWWAFLTSGFRIKTPGLVFLTLLFSMAFGVMIEIHQRFLPHRSAEVLDLVADILGCGAGILLSRIFFRNP